MTAVGMDDVQMARCASGLRRVGIILTCAAAMLAMPAAAKNTPRRVVSMNVCTDQLAMLIADEGQLHSVSHMGADPAMSVMADEAQDYVINHGQAEEVFLMRPDLVLAGAYTTRTTVAMLRRLGFRVEEFAPESSFDDIRANITRMGALLGRPERAAELVAELDAGLAALAAEPSGLTVALYAPNSYTSGEGTLADAVVEAAGLSNIADDLGLAGTARLPLEMLVLADPDLIVSEDRYRGAPALAGENFRHPAYRALSDGRRVASAPGRYWVCGAPYTLEAVRILREAARDVEGERP